MLEQISMLQKAREFAEKKHAGQTRKFSGEPYIYHPMAVADILYSIGAIKLAVAGYLHDTLEDTDTTKMELIQKFDLDIATIVGEVTNDPEQIKKMSKAKYMLKKMDEISEEASLLKLADMYMNIRQLSLDIQDRAFIERTVKTVAFVLLKSKKLDIAQYKKGEMDVETLDFVPLTYITMDRVIKLKRMIKSELLRLKRDLKMRKDK